MKLIVWPKSALADEVINITAKELDSDQCYTLVLSTLDEKGTLFRSYAYYKSDRHGCIDLRRDAALSHIVVEENNSSVPLSPSYTGVFASGLFSTLKSAKQYERLIKRNVTKPLEFMLTLWKSTKVLSSSINDDLLYRLTSALISQSPSERHVEDENVIKRLNLSKSEMTDKRFQSVNSEDNLNFDDQLFLTMGLLGTQKIDRSFMGLNVQRCLVKEGTIRGVLFIPDGKGPFPSVIDMFGAAGGLVEYRAALLASRGIMTLALAYFRYDDLPESMDRLSLDYVEEAVEWLLRHPKTNTSSGGVGVLGASKGGELAIATACHTSHISALCTINGNITSIGALTTHCRSGSKYLPTPLNLEKVLIYDDNTINIRNLSALPFPPEFMDKYSKYLEPYSTSERHIVNSGKETSKRYDNYGLSEDLSGKTRGIEAMNKLEGRSREQLERKTKTDKSADPIKIKVDEKDNRMLHSLRIEKEYFETVEKSMYKLEQISAPWCLFIAGEEDQNWLSPVYALEARRRLLTVDKNRHVEVIIYPKAGHYIDPPCAPFEYASFHRLAKAVVIWGGNPYYHQLAQVNCWSQVIQFFTTALKNQSTNSKL